MPSAPPTPRLRRLHVTLFAATYLSLAFTGGAFWEEALLSWSDLLSPAIFLDVMMSGLPYATYVVLILGAHEMGHYLACRRYAIPATLPFFIPGLPPLGSFGAVIRIKGIIPNRKALFDVAAAGPIAGFSIALPLLIAGVVRAEPFVPSPEVEGVATGLGPPLVLFLVQPLIEQNAAMHVNSMFGAGWVGMLVTSLNLFPVGQLDGGHAAYAISRRLHRFTAIFAIAGLLALIMIQIVAFWQFPAYLAWFVILLWMRDRHPRLSDERSGIGVGRILLALVLALLFLLSFIPVPFVITGA
jgi:membrane-associated protease RseP (regulator of RpoE activity)